MNMNLILSIVIVLETLLFMWQQKVVEKQHSLINYLLKQIVDKGYKIDGMSIIKKEFDEWEEDEEDEQ